MTHHDISLMNHVVKNYGSFMTIESKDNGTVGAIDMRLGTHTLSQRSVMNLRHELRGVDQSLTSEQRATVDMLWKIIGDDRCDVSSRMVVQEFRVVGDSEIFIVAVRTSPDGESLSIASASSSMIVMQAQAHADAKVSQITISGKAPAGVLKSVHRHPD